MPGVFSGMRVGGLPYIDCQVGYPSGAAWPQSAQAPIAARALIDTGATNVVIGPALLARMILPATAPMDHVVVGGGSRQCQTVACEIIIAGRKAADLAQPFTYTVKDVRALNDHVHGADLILGWDVLRFFDLTFSRDDTFVLRAG